MTTSSTGPSAHSGTLEFAIIVPVLNECGNIIPMFDALTKTLADRNWEVIFVDDGSTDGTIDQLDRLALNHSHVRAVKRFGKGGLASAVIEGAMSSAAPIVAVIDGDMQHDESKLPAMYGAIASGDADLALGTRYAKGGSTGDWDETRLKGSQWATRVTQMFMRTKVSDPMSGFFAVRRDVIANLRPKLSGIGFKILLDLLVTDGGNLRVYEEPYTFRGRTSGESKMSAKVVIELLTFFIEKTIGRILPTRLILFVMVGGLGLVVHLVSLKIALSQFGMGFALAQTVAVGIAIASNFLLNNIVTFADRKLKGWALLKGLVSFYIVCGTGAIANIGVGTLVFENNSAWWVAGVAGAIIGAVWNYAASSLFTWKKT